MSDRRTEILDAAASLIAEKGFSQTSVEDVIRRSGLCGKAHFYHYFSSKDELGLEVLDHQFERFADRGLAMLREPMVAPLDRLGRFIDSLVATQVECGCRLGSPFGRLAMEMCDAREEFRARLAIVFERWAGQLESLLWEARPQLVDSVDGARLSRFIIATLEGGMMMSRVNRDAKVLEGVAADLKRFIQAHTRSGDQVAADT